MKYLLAISFLLFLTASKAQFHPSPPIKRYPIELKTNKGKVSGILEQNNDMYITVSTHTEVRNIAIASIKSIKIREPRQAKTVEISIIPEPLMADYDENGKLRVDYTPPTVGERAAKGILSGVFSFFHRLVRGEYSSLAKFKVNYSENEYQAHIHEITPFSVYYQKAPLTGAEFFGLPSDKTIH